ncbi:hypothetical protein Agub_g9574 [Astrephomene gubernaculifera]|uniref:Uncharacterized protein n=1 Tax=Astrephomene gubernaculifera TaxID=47775 RepID=A0AAD3DTJ0_9CHLO|nr:hypothetical protein Agub_g9574 [Astrephomene gubernaculifera]
MEKGGGGVRLAAEGGGRVGWLRCDGCATGSHANTLWRLSFTLLIEQSCASKLYLQCLHLVDWKEHGTFFSFPPAAARHLPVLMACHLPPPLQRLLRAFSLPAQAAITARAMALHAATSDEEYFRDQRLEAALTTARSCNPPQDRYSSYTQTPRLTGRKRKPTAAPQLPQQHTPGAGSSTPSHNGGSRTPTAAATANGNAATANGSADVDMDAGGWAFAGNGTVHCPGGVACRKPGRHENWLFSDAANKHITYLPVIYDTAENSAVLLPLADPRVGPTAGGGTGGGGGSGGGPSSHLEGAVVWFRYEYESRAGRRGHNFWDYGLPKNLEQAVRDVAGEDALRLALGCV